MIGQAHLSFGSHKPSCFLSHPASSIAIWLPILPSTLNTSPMSNIYIYVLWLAKYIFYAQTNLHAFFLILLLPLPFGFPFFLQPSTPVQCPTYIYMSYDWPSTSSKLKPTFMLSSSSCFLHVPFSPSFFDLTLQSLMPLSRHDHPPSSTHDHPHSSTHDHVSNPTSAISP